MAAKESVKRQK